MMLLLAHLGACPGTGGGGVGDRERGAATDPSPTAREQAPSPAEARTLIARSAELLRSMARTLRAADSDCDALAVEIGRWIDRNERELATLLESISRIPIATRAELMRDALGDDPVISDCLGALEACRRHDGVDAAVRRLGPSLY